MIPENNNISNSQHPSLHSKPRFGFQHTYAYVHTQQTHIAHVFKIANNTFSTIDSTRLKCHLQY